MAAEMGLGTCGVCESQIGEGVPIGVLSHAPFIMGHKDCVDKRKAENLMVKISKQDGPAGPIGEYVDAVESTTIVDTKGVVETEKIVPEVKTEPEYANITVDLSSVPPGIDFIKLTLDLRSLRR